MSKGARTSFARRAEFYDRIVSDAELSRAALAVAWRLVNHINDETAECFPSGGQGVVCISPLLKCEGTSNRTSLILSHGQSWIVVKPNNFPDINIPGRHC